MDPASAFAGARIIQPRQIADIVQSKSTALVDSTYPDAGSTSARTTFRFRDRTISTQLYFPESTTLGRGLLLPPQVRAIFDRALHNQANAPPLFFPTQSPARAARDESMTGQLAYQSGCLRLVTPEQRRVMMP